MNIKNLSGIAVVNKGAAPNKLDEIEKHIKSVLPIDYRELMISADGFSFENGLVVYSTDELIERNETFEVDKYAPGHLAIGDDSGGRCILLSLASGKLFLVDQGSMDPDDMETLANLKDWLSRNCPI